MATIQTQARRTTGKGLVHLPLLSKTRFVSGAQCAKRLYLECWEPDRVPEPSVALQAIFDRGHDVGALARRRYPGGVLIEQDREHGEEALEATARVMADPAVPAIFEGAFFHDGVLVRADIVVRLPRGRWRLEEVKSSTSVHDVHLPDLAVQLYVLRGAGLRVSQAGILHLNKEYVRRSREIDLGRLFTFADLRREAAALDAWLRRSVRRFRGILRAEEPPEVEPGEHCHDPYDCPFTPLCIEPPGPYHVSQLPRSGKLQRALADRGIDDLRELPEDVELTDLQRRVHACVVEGREHVSEGLGDDLRDVAYPVHFLDFETYSPAVPRYRRTGVYQPLPFQWSAHALGRSGGLSHREFLHDGDSDPRLPFLESLLGALGDRGTVYVYSSYERQQLEALAGAFPRHRRSIEAVIGRFRDLLAIVREHYYHPGFGGSFSIKSVLPALVPSMSYEGLAIGDGEEASAAYAEMISAECSPVERRRLRRALLTYCAQDTLAMVRIRERLLASASRRARR